jgi:hypothetical protein
VTGQAKLLTKALGQPTGVALRSDERVLYIADNAYNGTSPPAILSLPLRSDGVQAFQLPLLLALGIAPCLFTHLLPMLGIATRTICAK